MKILSIDVGIYNLACCILNIQQSVTIEFWKDINILSGKETCSTKGCKCVATHVKDNLFYCIKCKTSLFPKQRLQTVKTATNTPIEKIAIDLYSTLDNVFTDINVDKVLIENQPTKNIKMKNISMLILGYFTRKGYECEFVNASKKMKETTCFYKNVILPNNYANRKKASKLSVKSMLGNSDWGLFFKTSKKQDDLSDCLLQAMWWIHTKVNPLLSINTSNEIV